MDFSSFCPDLIVEILSVCVLGVFIWFLQENQKRQQLAKLSKSAKKRYLEGIRQEINANLNLMNGKHPLQPAKLNTPLCFKTTYWDGLVPSGLLPAILHEEGLHKGITDFYYQLRIIDTLLNPMYPFFRDRWTQPDDQFIAAIGGEKSGGPWAKEILLPEIHDAKAQAQVLLRRLDSEISSLN